MRTCVYALALLSLPVLGFAQDKAPEPEKVALQGVKVCVGNGVEMPTATVCIADGKIISVEKGESSPNGFTVIKAQGKTLYPGFIDAHWTRGVKSPPAPVDTGKPNASLSAPASLWIGNRKGITPEWMAADNLDLAPDKSFYEAGLTAINVLPAGGSFRGIGACMNLLPATSTNRVVNQNTFLAMSFRIGSGTGYPSNILGQIALMRQVLWDAKSLSEGAELYPSGEKEPFWMSSLKALQPVLKGETPTIFEVNIDREIERAFRLREEFNFPLILAGARDAYKHAAQIEAEKVPLVLGVDMGFEPSLTATSKDDLTPQDIRQERHDKWKALVSGNVNLLNNYVGTALTSNGNASDLLKNLRFLVKNGLKKDRALMAMTLMPAMLLKVSGVMGSVEVGKQANLVLASGDLFEEGTSVERVWVEGRPVLAPVEKKPATGEVK
jgi:imidazolonepropionase-like amidohydrolase